MVVTHYMFVVLVCIFPNCSTKKLHYRETPVGRRQHDEVSWTEVLHYYSAGKGSSWQPTHPDKAEVVTFGRGNSFRSNRYPRFDHFVLQSGDKLYSRLKVYQTGSNDTLHWSFRKITSDSIEIDYMCIEGCSKRFKRNHFSSKRIL